MAKHKQQLANVEDEELFNAISLNIEQLQEKGITKEPEQKPDNKLTGIVGYFDKNKTFGFVDTTDGEPGYYLKLTHVREKDRGKIETGCKVKFNLVPPVIEGGRQECREVEIIS